MTRSKNSRAESSSSQGPVRKTPTSVAPASSSKAISRSGQTSGTGAFSGRKQSDRMRIKRDRQRRNPGRVGLGPEPGEQSLMAAVNSVEVADRDESASSPRGEVTNVLDRDHRHFAPLLEPAALSD